MVFDKALNFQLHIFHFIGHIAKGLPRGLIARGFKYPSNQDGMHDDLKSCALYNALQGFPCEISILYFGG